MPHPTPGPATRLLHEMVQAASPNPPGDEVAVAEVIRGFLAGVPGVTVEDVGVAPRRPMLVARLEFARPGPTLLLNGHMDTVPAGDGWTRDPFGAEIDGGRMYGRGSADMKAGLAGLLVAFGELARRADRLSGAIELHAVPDEEPGGHWGAEVLLAAGRMRGDFAVVAEPTELRVFRAQKGNVFVNVTLTGRSAHGSMPHNGVNAVSAAARLIADLEDRLGAELATRTHPLVGARTVNVGTIAGGTATNVVPDRCVLGVDCRVIPGGTVAEALAELTAFIGDRGTIEPTHLGEPFETPEDDPLVVAAQAAVAASWGEPKPCGGLVGSSDARFYAVGAGIPTILLGPGSLDQAHVPDEWVEVAQVEASVPLYIDLAHRLLD
ncbi:MAG: M20 family metallopeptidase [Thermoleophilia bacterium]